jgi:hypothetical protein
MRFIVIETLERKKTFLSSIQIRVAEGKGVGVKVRARV